MNNQYLDFKKNTKSYYLPYNVALLKFKFMGLHHTCSPLSPACSQRWWDPCLVPQITDQVSGPRGLTRWSSLQQSFSPGRVPEGFLVPSLQNLWRETLDMRFDKGAPSRPLLGISTFCPQPSMALLALAQSNQCADYCTTALSWTGSLNTGATEQDLQKLPSLNEKSCPGAGESLSSCTRAYSASPLNSVCCIDWDTLKGCDFQSWRGTFAAD